MNERDWYCFLKRAGAPTKWEWILLVVVSLAALTFASCGAALFMLLR